MELYGIKTKVLQGDAQRPATSKSCLVYFAGASSTEKTGEPVKVTSYKEYKDIYHKGTEPKTTLLLDKAAEYALSLVGEIWCVNCKSAADNVEATATEIKDLLEPALAKICLESADVPNIICVPGIQDATCLKELVRQCKGEINNNIHAQGFVDCTQAANQIKDNNSPDASKITVPLAEGCLISAWGNGIIDKNETGLITKHVPMSIVLSARRGQQDAENAQNVPYRSVGNLRVDLKGLCIVTELSGSPAYVECTCRQDHMNAVVENGIVSLVNKGNNRWYTWGDHTSAVSAGTVDDETYRFDSNVAILYHVLNRFVAKWGHIIDSPMSLRLRDCIVSEEQDYLNGLKALGCLIGEPRCEFRSTDNTKDSLAQGQFYFVNLITVVPPAKYVELRVQYTDAGLAAYIEG